MPLPNITGTGSDVEARLLALEAASNETQEEEVEEPKRAGLVIPHWRCIAATGLTLNATYGAASWIPAFMNVAATNRVLFSLATSRGELDMEDVGPTGVSYHELTWESDQPFTAGYWLYENGTSGAGNCQVHFNGVLTNLAISASYGTLEVRPGRNQLIIMRDTLPDGIRFISNLFDGRTSRWVDADEYGKLK